MYFTTILHAFYCNYNLDKFLCKFHHVVEGFRILYTLYDLNERLFSKFSFFNSDNNLSAQVLTDANKNIKTSKQAILGFTPLKATLK